MTKSIEEKAEGYATGVVAEWPDKYMPSMSQGNLDLIVVKAFIAGAKSRDEELTRLEGLVRDATEALEFYGSDETWVKEKKIGNIYGTAIEWDMGDAARDALSKLRGEAAEGGRS